MSKKILVSLLTLKCANDLKRVMVIHSTNFLCFLAKSATFLRFTTLKHKNEIKIVKKILALLLTLKRGNALKRFMVIHSTNFWCFLAKSTTFLRFLTLKLNNEIKIRKKILVLLLTLKHTKWA